MIVRVPQGENRPLRIAVPKGALFADSVRALALAGVDVDGLADPGRHLIVNTPGYEFIIAKPTDVPIYVAYGTVVGAGSILRSDVPAEDTLVIVGPPPSMNQPFVPEEYRNLNLLVAKNVTYLAGLDALEQMIDDDGGLDAFAS